ncbi:maltose ABC transporter permease [Thermus thermophilus]|nr:maltose ABC transporter permease [Thermus thermophilus]
MRKLVAFLLTGLALYGVYWFAANRLFDEGSYRKQVAFGSVFVPYGWAYALGFLGPWSSSSSSIAFSTPPS